MKLTLHCLSFFFDEPRVSIAATLKFRPQLVIVSNREIL